MTSETGRMAKLGFQTSAGVTSQPAVDLDTLVRSVLFLAAFLAAWISFHPFPDLSLPPQAVVQGGDPANQIGFTALILGFAGWLYYHEPRRLLLVLRPVLIATIAWCALSVIASWEPLLAARRLAFELIVIAHFRHDPFAAEKPAALHRSVGRGDADRARWRPISAYCCCRNMRSITPPTFSNPNMPATGAAYFRHKNNAGAAMVLFVFIGIYVARMRSFALGAAIVALAALFLAFTQSKTAIGVLADCIDPVRHYRTQPTAGGRHRPRRDNALCFRTVFRRHGRFSSRCKI